MSAEDGTGLKQGDVRTSGIIARAKRKSQSPSLRGDLGVCQVINVNYEEFFVTLRVILGNDFLNERVPVPLTFPGAGTRHFLGAMPTVGDYCICGWIPQDSIGTGLANQKGTMTPVILAWIPRGAWLGHDWVFTSPLAETEKEMTPKQQDELRGVYTQHRHKRLHMRPGDVVASSSKGSDILLNEGVYITNRRANEIRLRDQDQAFVVRSLQQFHLMSGVRTYGGMVQRDSRLLQGAVRGDGIKRDGARQVDSAGNPVVFSKLTPFEVIGENFAPSIGSIGLDASLFPQTLMQQQGLGLYSSSSVYGGKPMYRVAIDEDNNSFDNTLGSEIPTFTEYRLEVNHYSDGLLPVTEQTEGLDVDKETNLVEIAYGTVVGNDQINEGDFYGKPMIASVFPTPRLSAIESQHSLVDHLASLFRVNSLDKNGVSLPPTFFAVNKDGRVKVSIGGSRDTNSLDLRVEGKTKLDFSGGLEFVSKQPFKVKTQDQTDDKNVGIELSSETGAVVIQAKGKMSTPLSEVVNPTGKNGDPQQAPSILLTSSDTHLEGDNSVEINTKKATIQATQTLDIESGNSINMTVGDGIIKAQSKQWDQSVTGKADYNYSGPLANQLGVPSNQKLPLRKTTFSSSAPQVLKQVVDEHKYTIGSREEVFNLGNHTTTMRVGNMTYNMTLGKHTIKAGVNTHTLDAKTGYNLSVSTGAVSSQALSGANSIVGSASVSISTGGAASITAAGVITLSSPGGGVGGILSSSTINPLNGQPFGSPLNGLQGSKKHILA